jgi:putative endonuclease
MRVNHSYFIYIIACSDNSYYTGITNTLERRIWEHNSGYNQTCYTYKRRPVELTYYECFQDVKQAIAREKQLKGWSRKKKEALFREDWEEIKRLAKSSRNSAADTSTAPSSDPSTDPSTSSG